MQLFCEIHKLVCAQEIIKFMINLVYTPPNVFRYENENHVDDFFNHGKIRLSSFEKYRHMSIKNLADEKEGCSGKFETNFSSNLIEGKIEGSIKSDSFFYCLCCSSTLHPELLKEFNRNSVFRIKDVVGFSMELQKVILSATEVIHFGNCQYFLDRKNATHVGKLLLEFQPTSGQMINPVEIFGLNLLGNNILYLKDIKYQKQNEYRILWMVNKMSGNYIDFECPEAVNFCEKITQDELFETSYNN